MRYLLLICADETVQLTPEEGAAMGSPTMIKGEAINRNAIADAVKSRGQ